MLVVAGGALLLAAAVLTFSSLRRDSVPGAGASTAAGTSLADLQITQLTTSGTAERPAISPDGRYVAYVQRDGDSYSLWLRQTTTTSTVQVVPSQPGVTLLGSTFTPDGTSIDFVRQAAGAPADVWRVPFLGGTPRPLVAEVASPISWAPDGRRIAFLRTRFSPTLSSQLFVAAADGGQERELASDVAPEPWISLVAPWRPSFAPAWSPDGKLIAIAAVGRVVFVNGENGSLHDVVVSPQPPSGLSWLNADSLVFNQPAQIGSPGQLYRLPYPVGPLSRLTNDVSNYVGASLTSDGSGLVTGLRDWRMDLWVGDGDGGGGRDIVRRAPISVDRLAWSGEQLLYGTVVGGRPAIMRVTPGQDTSEEVLLDALSPGVTSDGSTIVFVTSSPEARPVEGGRERPPGDPARAVGDDVANGDHARRSVGALHVPHRPVGGDLDGRDRRRHAGEAHRRRQRVGVPGRRVPGLHRQSGVAHRLRASRVHLAANNWFRAIRHGGVMGPRRAQRCLRK